MWGANISSVMCCWVAIPVMLCAIPYRVYKRTHSANAVRRRVRVPRNGADSASNSSDDESVEDSVSLLPVDPSGNGRLANSSSSNGPSNVVAAKPSRTFC